VRAYKSFGCEDSDKVAQSCVHNFASKRMKCKTFYESLSVEGESEEDFLSLVGSSPRRQLVKAFTTPARLLTRAESS
jgi:hypothetical protein